MKRTGQLGVCSWSLQAHSPRELAERVRAVGVDCLQLLLDPLRTREWAPEETMHTLGTAGLTVRSGAMGMVGEDYSTLATIRATGGVRPDATWEANRANASENAKLARALGLTLITFHAGFLPEEAGPERTKLVARLREIVDRCAEYDVNVAFETGQETAATLLAFLSELERPRAGVNFDPANLILYDTGEPVAALAALAPHVRQIHVKDARRTQVKDTWGSEVAVGSGEVDWPRFFAVAAEHALAVDLMIEREAGEDRVADMRRARELVEHEWH